MQADGKIILAGDQYPADVSSDSFLVVRLNGNGSLDDHFGDGGKKTFDFGTSYSQAFAVALQADGKIAVSGQSARHYRR